MSAAGAGARRRPGLLRSTITVAAGTAASRVLGMVREILMAVLFGTSLAKSAFDIAFLVPNLFRRVMGEGESISARLTFIMSSTGMPSVMQTISSMPASIASRIESAAKGGGT